MLRLSLLSVLVLVATMLSASAAPTQTSTLSQLTSNSRLHLMHAGNNKRVKRGTAADVVANIAGSASPKSGLMGTLRKAINWLSRSSGSTPSSPKIGRPSVEIGRPMPVALPKTPSRPPTTPSAPRVKTAPAPPPDLGPGPPPLKSMTKVTADSVKVNYDLTASEAAEVDTKWPSFAADSKMMINGKIMPAGVRDMDSFVRALRGAPPRLVAPTVPLAGAEDSILSASASQWLDELPELSLDVIEH